MIIFLVNETPHHHITKIDREPITANKYFKYKMGFKTFQEAKDEVIRLYNVQITSKEIEISKLTTYRDNILELKEYDIRWE
jgi:hypothetical protein